MNCYYIRTKNQRHFIIQAETAQQAMAEVSQERTHICPWTKKTLFVEPALPVQYCERLSKDPSPTKPQARSLKKQTA